MSQACGVCCDVMWESGARDQVVDTDTDTNTERENRSSTMEIPPFQKESWKGGNGNSGGPLEGRPPSTFQEAKQLAMIVTRMSQSLAQSTRLNNEESSEENDIEDGDGLLDTFSAQGTLTIKYM